jgi:hypothetical protein
METAPASFSMTQMRRPPGLERMRFRRTVFPAPRKPARKTGGRGEAESREYGVV